MDAEMAWATGLFEGEGTVTFTGTSLQARLGMTDLDVVEHFQAVVGGGTIAVRPRVRPGYKDIWSYGLCGFEKVQHLYVQMWPLLGQRRRDQYARALGRYLGLHRDRDFALRVFGVRWKDLNPTQRRQYNSKMTRLSQLNGTVLLG